MPKQFVPLVEGRSLFSGALERAALLNPEIVCISNIEHRFLVEDAARMAGRPVSQLLEPLGRNTAPAMTCAAMLAEPEHLLLFMPADHHIPDSHRFADMVSSAVQLAEEGYWVTFGVQPSFPSTAYGYIRQGIKLGEITGHAVEAFIEKPSAEKAQEFLVQGGYLWNAGIFLVKASSLVSAVRQHAADIFESCSDATDNLATLFGHRLLDRNALEKCRNQSIDHAVLEKHDRVAVVDFDGMWSDVGSWDAVANLHEADDQGNRLDGAAYVFDCENVFVRGQGRPVVVLGMSNMVVIDTVDALLVSNLASAQKVRSVVEHLKSSGVTQASQHRRMLRPWGSYDCLDVGECFQVKRLIVNPGAALSLQLHEHRAEHWVVVRGVAKVTRGEETFLLQENQSTFISCGTRHRLENPGDSPLEVIEVQSGTYLGEDDIVRFEDAYGRG